MDLILNQSPVLTSKNYYINNVKIPNFSMPKAQEFLNFSIENFENYDKKPQQISLQYGMNKELITQSNQNSNINIGINIEENQILEKPIIIEFNFDDNNTFLVDNINIKALKNSKATIIIKYISTTSSNNSNIFYKNSVLISQISETADINISVINLLPTVFDYNFFTNQNLSEKNSKYTLNLVDFGGKYSVNNIFSNVSELNSESNINGLYIGSSNQILDYNIISQLNGENSIANIEVQGVLDDNAQKSFKGTLDFKRGACNSVGYENEFCTILSSDARSIGLPMLLCEEEDVSGTHSCASGAIDKDILFYIESRGISEKEARKLIIKANFHTILQNILCEKSREEIIYQIDRRIN